MSQYVTEEGKERRGREESRARRFLEREGERRIEMRENGTPQIGRQEISAGKKLTGEKRAKPSSRDERTKEGMRKLHSDGAVISVFSRR